MHVCHGMTWDLYIYIHAHKGMRGMFYNFFKKSQKGLSDSAIEELKLALQFDARTSPLSFLGSKAPSSVSDLLV